MIRNPAKNKRKEGHETKGIKDMIPNKQTALPRQDASKGDSMLVQTQKRERASALARGGAGGARFVQR